MKKFITSKLLLTSIKATKKGWKVKGKITVDNYKHSGSFKNLRGI